jgi:hypothetical protein
LLFTLALCRLAAHLILILPVISALRYGRAFFTGKGASLHQAMSRVMNRALATASKLPAFLIPCPLCGGRMAIRLVTPTIFADDVDDITHSCNGCGAELTRTVKRAI